MIGGKRKYCAKHSCAKAAKAAKKSATYPLRAPAILSKSRISVEEISDSYVRQVLSSGTTLRRKDVPLELVQLKRLHLKLTRLIKEKQK